MIEKESNLIRDELLELLLQGKLNNSEKLKIIELVEHVEKATETQIERFSLYYGLNVNGKKPLNLVQIAKIYGCTVEAIRYSVNSMKRKILKYTDSNENLLIKNIIKECKERES